MKLYEINEQIQAAWDSCVDPETGEVTGNTEELDAKLSKLEMERSDTLQYLGKLLMNARAEAEALRNEEKRLAERRKKLEAQDERLCAVLDRECAGAKTDLGVCTVKYTPTHSLIVSDLNKAVSWLEDNKGNGFVKYAEPQIDKNAVKKLIKDGEAVPGCFVRDGVSCTVK